MLTTVGFRQLSISTNNIERLIPMPGMAKLRVLSVGRNCLKKIEKLEDNAGTLTELWASYNMISTFDGITSLPNLEILFLSNNHIADWNELTKLAACPKLKDILLVGNPIYEGLGEAERRVKVLQVSTSTILHNVYVSKFSLFKSIWPLMSTW